MSTADDLYWPEESRRVFEEARLELARLPVRGRESLRELARRVTELSARTLRVDRVGIWVYRDERTALHCYDLYERSRDEHGEGMVLHAADFPTYFRALEARRDIPADLASSDPLTQELHDAYLAPLGITSLLDAPIYQDGRVGGVVCHEQVGRPRRWSPDERGFAASVADACSLLLETALRQEAEAAVQTHQAYLAEHQKLEALGRLAAGVAHDFKNLLHGILGYAQLIAESRAAPDDVRADARTILGVAERGVALTRDLLDYGGRGPQGTRVIDVAEVMDHMAGVLRAAAGPPHTVRVERTGPVGRVLLDPAQLERVVLNLVVNARDALAHGGEILVRLGSTRVEEGPVPRGWYVVVAVCDTGTGMDAATQARMFEPFFTTKQGKGTGLGLAIVKQVVDRCGGFIRVESEPGKGTTVSVHLPRVAGQADTAGPGPAPG
jgi:signal transduction histidine kinase